MKSAVARIKDAECWDAEGAHVRSGTSAYIFIIERERVTDLDRRPVDLRLVGILVVWMFPAKNVQALGVRAWIQLLPHAKAELCCVHAPRHRTFEVERCTHSVSPQSAVREILAMQDQCRRA
jgi:hypothetical protein